MIFSQSLLRYTTLMKVAFLLTQGPPMLSQKRNKESVLPIIWEEGAGYYYGVCQSCRASNIYHPWSYIFDAKRLNPEWTNGEFPGTTYGLSDNEWIITELFEAWMSEHFLQHAVSARPLLLLLDGHSTHYQPQFFAFHPTRRTKLSHWIVVFLAL